VLFDKGEIARAHLGDKIIRQQVVPAFSRIFLTTWLTSSVCNRSMKDGKKAMLGEGIIVKHSDSCFIF